MSITPNNPLCHLILISLTPPPPLPRSLTLRTTSDLSNTLPSHPQILLILLIILTHRDHTFPGRGDRLLTLTDGFDIGYRRMFLAFKDRVDLLESTSFRFHPEHGLSPTLSVACVERAGGRYDESEEEPVPRGIDDIHLPANVVAAVKSALYCSTRGEAFELTCRWGGRRRERVYEEMSHYMTGYFGDSRAAVERKLHESKTVGSHRVVEDLRRVSENVSYHLKPGTRS